ncbi:Transposase, partial [Clostridium sp. DSM 8431]|uniref:transposase n=1 Tax=Clostridium sp. DSM 8431 TaxID=1761781 RepID=UPI0008F03D95
VNAFRHILKEKDINKLDLWIEESLKLNISEIKSFVNGINQDIDAVKNAIILKYNNGLAEGSVNKIKVIKRIMYGRCSFETLRMKVIKLESLKV